jgi:hypothetical protein
LRRANEIIRKAAAFFALSDARPLEEIVIFIDEDKIDYGALADLPNITDRFVEYLRKKASSNESRSMFASAKA